MIFFILSRVIQYLKLRILKMYLFLINIAFLSLVKIFIDKTMQFP